MPVRLGKIWKRVYGVNGLLQMLRGFGLIRLVLLAGVGLGGVAFFIYIMGRLGAPDMALLYSELETSDSSQIVTKLEAAGIPYKLRGNGSQIFVPRDQALRLRMTMAEEGLPSGGSVGYEIFDRSDGFGASNFVNNINRVRALEGELSRTISSLSRIRAARVHLVLPRRELFSRERGKASATIVIKILGRAEFDRPQVLAIQHLVASAVPGLNPNRVSVIDSRGNLLARSNPANETEQVAASNADALRRAYEARMARRIEQLLERSVGAGKVSARVSAEMDFDRIVTNSETFDPDSQVARSTQVVEEETTAADKGSQGSVSVSAAIADPTAASAGKAAGSSNRSLRTESTTNYEISKTVRRHVRESGVVRRLSVAVIVDGIYTKAADGKQTYKPRDAKEMAKLTALVRSTIGYSASRSDTVEVVNMRFATGPVEIGMEAEESLFDFSKAEYLRLAEIAVLAILGILVLLLVIRPLLKRLVDFDPATARDMIRTAAASAPRLAAPEESEEEEARAESLIDLEQVEGKVRASSISKLGDLVDNHPDETVAIIRNWMYQEN